MSEGTWKECGRKNQCVFVLMPAVWTTPHTCSFTLPWEWCYTHTCSFTLPWEWCHIHTIHCPDPLARFYYLWSATSTLTIEDVSVHEECVIIICAHGSGCLDHDVPHSIVLLCSAYPLSSFSLLSLPPPSTSCVLPPTQDCLKGGDQEKGTKRHEIS